VFVCVSMRVRVSMCLCLCTGCGEVYSFYMVCRRRLKGIHLLSVHRYRESEG
jgi:hypothetical protein